MDVQTRYAHNGDVSLAYQAIGDGPLDVLFLPESSPLRRDRRWAEA